MEGRAETANRSTSGPEPGGRHGVSFRHWFLLFIIFLVALEGATVLVLKLNRPPYNDEVHFAATIQQFGTHFSLSLLKTYNELSTPLPFLLYGIWGRVIGFEVPALRLFSLLQGLATGILFYWLFLMVLKDERTSFLVAAFLAIHPYMMAVSFAVYTDVTTMLMVILTCVAVARRNPVLFALASAGGLLCRQYFIFLTAAGLVYYLFRAFAGRERSSVAMVISGLASLLPLLFLVALWKGMSPNNAMKQYWLVDEEFLSFHPSSASLYISQLFVYLIPVIAFRVRDLYRDWRVILGSVLVSGLYWLAPVRPAAAILREGGVTVGLFNSLLLKTLKTPVLVHTVFFFACCLALPIVFQILHDCYLSIRRKDYGFSFFLDLSILAFLLIMPFSYYVWEKYFLPVVPLAAIRILQFRRRAPRVDRPVLNSGAS